MSAKPPRRLEWDSSFFGSEIARLDLPHEAGIDQNLAVARDVGVECLYVFVRGDRFDLLEETVRRGGQLVDIRVELERSGSPAPAAGSTRLAGTADETMVAEYAARLAAQSRFWRDAHFAPERVEAMYRVWGRLCLEEGVIALPGHGRGGLVGARVHEGVADVELVWVDPADRGRGVARELVLAAVEALGADGARVATQAGNVAALRLYEALGFRTTTVTSILHVWLDRAS